MSDFGRRMSRMTHRAPRRSRAQPVARVSAACRRVLQSRRRMLPGFWAAASESVQGKTPNPAYLAPSFCAITGPSGNTPSRGLHANCDYSVATSVMWHPPAAGRNSAAHVAAVHGPRPTAQSPPLPTREAPPQVQHDSLTAGSPKLTCISPAALASEPCCCEPRPAGHPPASI